MQSINRLLGLMQNHAAALLLAPSNKLEQYYKTLVAAGTPYTYEQVCNVLSEQKGGPWQPSLRQAAS